MIQPRILFQVKQYEHPTLGNLYRCYVSTTQRDDNNYLSCLYIANTEQGVKIVAQYNTDFVSGGTGPGECPNRRSRGAATGVEAMR